MFTGIVDHLGKIIKLRMDNKSMQLWIESGFTELKPGESIAVNGICLTVIEPQQSIFQCDISPETWELTTAKFLQQDSLVNLERSLTLTDRLGGHFVMGHVDKICRVNAIEKINEFKMITFSGLTTDNKKYLVKKGSITVNGVSLTINEITSDGFQVMLIPHTLERTNLQFLCPQDYVNIEFDYLARIVVNLTEQQTCQPLSHP